MPHQMQIKATARDPASMNIDLKSCQAVLFDMDGVITRTTGLHSSAWKTTFDKVLMDQFGSAFIPFDINKDYKHYVDGRPRIKGVESFLEARGISLPTGDPEDSPGLKTIWSIANLKNDSFHSELENQGVELYDSTIVLIRALREKGIKIAVVTASENCQELLGKADIIDLFDAKIDGKDAKELNLEGKPDPGVFLAASQKLGIKPEHAIVVEDAISGVKAGSLGGFQITIGVARDNNETLLLENGADFVVKDLAEVSLDNS